MSVTLRSYLGTAPLDVWRGVDGVEVDFDETGPTSARFFVVPTHAQVSPARLMGTGFRIDNDLGAPAWAGFAWTLEGSDDSETANVLLRGPEVVLDEITAPVVGHRSGPAADIVMGAFAASPVETFTEPGIRRYAGAVAPFAPRGESLWALATGLAEERGERFALTVGGTGFYFVREWLDPASPTDHTTVTLYGGHNATFDYTHKLRPGALELTASIASYGSGRGEVVSSSLKAPAGEYLGRRAAYRAVLVQGAAGLALTGRGGALAAPEITTRDLAFAALTARLRRALAPPMPVQVAVHDRALWSKLRPGVLVSARCPFDPLGVYANAVALITGATFRLTPPYACNLSATLWEVM